MNKPEDMFDIVKETNEIKIEPHGYTKTTYYIVNKLTGEKHFPKTRPYGYSGLIDCKRARTRLFNDIMKNVEKTLLG